LSENKVAGTASCNQYGGNISISNSEITFSNTYATKMACPNMSIEDEFLTAISEQTMQFTLENSILTLKNGATVLTFKKVD
jgi:heat shock protein HslJ